MSYIYAISMLSFALGMASCQSPDSKQAETKETASTVPQENPSAGTAQETQSDTLYTQKSEVTTGNSNLTAGGSSLTAGQSGLNTEISLGADQLFDFDKALLKPEAEPALEALAAQLQNLGQEPVEITGYTDSKGDDAYNEKLSLRRANAVKDWLLAKGLPNNFRTQGMGEKDPVAENTLANGADNPDGRAKNRRVEIKYLGSQSISK